MTDHIGRSKVAHDKVKLGAFHHLRDFVCDILDAHLRLFIIGCNLWRGDHHSLFTRELLLYATVEEESNVSIFLRLCSRQSAEKR
jgi:hypothetical protein